MKNFLQQTAESILNKIEWKQLNRVTLVLPSHRAGLVLKEELLRLQQERQAQAIWAPRVRTLTQLQDELSPLYAEDELLTIVRLYKQYSVISNQDSERMPLDMFYGWGRQMIADFTNVDASMSASEVPNFFANTVAAHELSTWHLDEEVEQRLRALFGEESDVQSRNSASIRAQYEVLWSHLYVIYCALHAEMEAENKGYSGMRQRAVISHWDDESIQKQIAGRTFIFVGFNYLLPVERDLMLRLKDAGQAMFYWDYMSNFQTNEKAFSFAEMNSKILGNNSERRIESGERRQVNIIECLSREAQAQFVHRWLLENYTEKGQKVGVVICDETMLEPVIYTLPAIRLNGETEVTPINITKGFPLRNTVIYARTMKWLYDRSNGKADEPVQPQLFDALLEALVPEQLDSSNGSDDTMSWQELLILESEYQVRKIINQLRLLVSNGVGDMPFTLKMLRLLMRRMMESVTMPFHGEPVTDVQVMGVLETRLLDFDKLLILNVEEGVVPQRQNDSSFIPFYLRKAYHMQTSDERATVYAYNFFRLISRANETTLLYASVDATEGGKGMSRFIMQMIYSDAFDVTRHTLREATQKSKYDLVKNEQYVSLLSRLRIENGVIKRPDGTPYRLSPSALNTYITCPLCFYWLYIERVKVPEDEKGPFLPNTIGSFVHHAMEFIYSTYLQCDNMHPRMVSADEIEAIYTNDAKMEEALKAAYFAMEKFKQEEHIAENVIIKGYVRNILERDKEDAKEGLQIYLLEQDRTFPMTLDGIGQVQLGGKIDRLDIYGKSDSQCLRIVDYKSGSYDDTTHKKKMTSSWDDLMTDPNKSYVRQTLIYSRAVMEKDNTQLPIEPHLYFCRHKLADIETKIAVEENIVTDYRKIDDEFIQVLKPKIQEILTTDRFPQCEEKDCPAFCPFFEYCGRNPKEF